MPNVKMKPQMLAEDTLINLEVRRSGDRVILIGAMSAEHFDRLMAEGAHLEDLEDDGHTEAIMTVDGWSA